MFLACPIEKVHHGPLVAHPPTTPTSCSSLTASVLPFPSHRTAAGTTDVSTSRIAVTDLLNDCDASNDRPPPTTTNVVPSRTVPSQSSHHPQAAPLGPFVPLMHKNSADCFHSGSARVNPLASLRCEGASTSSMKQRSGSTSLMGRHMSQPTVFENIVQAAASQSSSSSPAASPHAKKLSFVVKNTLSYV